MTHTDDIFVYGMPYVHQENQHTAPFDGNYSFVTSPASLSLSLSLSLSPSPSPSLSHSLLSLSLSLSHSLLSLSLTSLSHSLLSHTHFSLLLTSLSLSLPLTGTLMDHDILRLLLGRVPDHQPAHISGYVRTGLRNRAYPGVLRAELNDPRGRGRGNGDGNGNGNGNGSGGGGKGPPPPPLTTVTGILLRGLTPHEADILDEYEDEDYQREPVEVVLTDARSTQEEEEKEVRNIVYMGGYTGL